MARGARANRNCAASSRGELQSILPCILHAHLGTTQFHMMCLLMLQTQTKLCQLCSLQVFLVPR